MRSSHHHRSRSLVLARARRSRPLITITKTAKRRTPPPISSPYANVSGMSPTRHDQSPPIPTYWSPPANRMNRPRNTPTPPTIPKSHSVNRQPGPAPVRSDRPPWVGCANVTTYLPSPESLQDNPQPTRLSRPPSHAHLRSATRPHLRSNMHPSNPRVVALRVHALQIVGLGRG